MVVDIPSIYNVVIGHPMPNKLRVIILTYYIVIKFLMRIDIGELRSNMRELH